MNPFERHYPAGKTDPAAARAYSKKGWGKYKSREGWTSSLYGNVKLELPNDYEQPKNTDRMAASGDLPVAGDQPAAAWIEPGQAEADDPGTAG